MNNRGFDFELACKLANIKVSNSSKELKIKSVFNPLEKSNIGILLIFCFGIILGTFTILVAKDLVSTILGTLLGFGTGAIAFLFILSQLTNYFSISGNELKLRKRLKLTKQFLTTNHKIRMKTSIDQVKLKSQPGSGSDFRVVEIIISDNNNEYPLLEFQLAEENSSTANALGNEILRVIKERIKNL